jgi:hypothetical protein
MEKDMKREAVWKCRVRNNCSTTKPTIEKRKVWIAEEGRGSGAPR